MLRALDISQAIDMALCQNELLAVERGASFNGEALHQGARLFSSFHEPEITTFIWDTRIKGNQTPPVSTAQNLQNRNIIRSMRFVKFSVLVRPLHRPRKKQDAREICPGRDKTYCRHPNLGLVELRQILGADPGKMWNTRGTFRVHKNTQNEAFGSLWEPSGSNFRRSILIIPSPFVAGVGGRTCTVLENIPICHKNGFNRSRNPASCESANKSPGAFDTWHCTQRPKFLRAWAVTEGEDLSKNSDRRNRLRIWMSRKGRVLE